MLRPRLIGLILALMTLLVYLPATFNQFVNFDDPDYVAANDVVQNGLTWTGIKWAFIGAHAANWHPLTWLSHMFDCDLFRLNPAGPHLVNVLYHAINTVLLFTLILRLTGWVWSSALVAALFALHPLHVESVAWIAERKDVLSTFFTLLTLLSYVRYVNENRHRSFWFALGFFILALLSKPMSVTLPLVMLLLDYWPLKRFENFNSEFARSNESQISGCRCQLPLIFEKWPFFLLAAASCVITCWAQKQAVSPLANVPFSFRLENTAIAYMAYLGKMIWPLDLAIFYPLQAPIPWHLVATAIFSLLGISFIVWCERKSYPWLLMGWIWFLVTLLPVIGLVQVGGQAMADRYTYFPLTGIFLVLAFSVRVLVSRFNFLKKWIISMVILILAIFILLTERQLNYWHDSESLFTHAAAVAESEIAHINIGSALEDQNCLSAALTQYIIAWRLNTDSYLAYGNIGRILDAEGKTKQAATFYKKAAQRSPAVASVYENYGIVLIKLGRSDEAISQFFAAVRVEDSSAQPHFLIGRLYLQQGHDKEAVTQLRMALQLDPDNLEIIIFTISVLAADENPQVRDGAAARSLADKAVKLTDGQQPAVLDVLAMADAETGQFDEAAKNEQKAIKLVLAGDHKDDAVVMQQRLQFYLKHERWRESFKKN
jgi:tetratricopeptide (TPR) repeat protein